MNIGIVGLGLIGGSIAKAYKKSNDHIVYGYDIDKTSLSYAKLSEAIDDVLDDENLAICDLLFVALYPDAAISYINEKADIIRKSAFVIDVCGTKRNICHECFRIADDHGFTFIGGHPMAGLQFSGIKYSNAELFKNASMVIVPPVFDDIALLERIKELLAPLALGKITITTAEKHDELIAYTSQLAHIVSNAYVKSTTAQQHHGFSAGSYRDMTRVATLNENMWTQLFIENKDNLTHELDMLIEALTAYRDALSIGDSQKLCKLLHEGCECKARADG